MSLRRGARVLRSGWCLGLTFVLCTTTAAIAQQPLSAIDWLDQQDATPAALPQAPVLPAEDEPAVATTALAPNVSVQSLSQSGPRLIGLVPAEVTGLPPDLWVGSDLTKLTQLIRDLPDFDLPALQSLLYTVLLTESLSPATGPDQGERLALARLDALITRGALEPAKALVEQLGITTGRDAFTTWMDISLLTGDEDRACATLNASPHLSDDYALRVFCQGRAGQWEDAALTFGSAQALGLFSDDLQAVLTQYLDPETAEGSLVPPNLRDINPLRFRLFETIGEPVPTSRLDRQFAVADLRDIAGWKAQIEAAERLTRAGALPDNRLLGLYTDRHPAASGGVWDRVAKLQRFETALSTGSAEAVTKTLPTVWTAIAAANLQVPFANLFAERLTPFALQGRADDIARSIQLLSPNYEVAAQGFDDDSLATRIAVGDLPSSTPTGILSGAVFDAFNTAPPREDLIGLVAEKRLGEAILHALDLLHDGTRGNARALTDGLATLRALGLEDTARRAALQVLLTRG